MPLNGRNATSAALVWIRSALGFIIAVLMILASLAHAERHASRAIPNDRPSTFSPKSQTSNAGGGHASRLAGDGQSSTLYPTAPPSPVTIAGAPSTRGAA